MTKGSNVQVVLQDDEGPFIRLGTIKYRPPQGGPQVSRGKTVRAWPWTGGAKVEAQGRQTIWTRSA